LTPKSKGPFSGAPVLELSNDTKGKNKYIFGVSSTTKAQISNDAHLEIIVCGKETIKATEGNSETFVVEFVKGSTDP